ncbi:MAG: ATP-binding protein [Patescibacteria group bacterium]|nr:ATP-binding protein [Patescibacteria group bacterium]
MSIIRIKKDDKIRGEKKKLKRNKDNSREGNSYMRDFLTFLPLSICDVSPTGMIENVNKELEELSGFTLAEVAGEYLPKLFLRAQKIKELLEKSSEEDTIKNQELTLITKIGKEITVSVSVATRKDSDNNLSGYFLSITDISAQKAIQQQTEKKIKTRTKDLEESRRAVLNILEDTEAAKVEIEKEKTRTQIVLNNFLDGLLIFGSDKKLWSINPRAEEFLKITMEEVLDKTMEEIGEITGIKELANVKKIKKKVFREELVPQEKGLILEMTIQKVGLPNKPETDTLVILHDISREKVIEQLKSQFVSVAAHQLRTPLSIIKWSLSMMIQGELGSLTDEQKEILEKTNQTNERMIRLINDLLNVARIEEGRFIYRPQAVDFNELLQDIIKPIHQLADEKKIKLKASLTKEPKVVRADTEKLALATKNLIENAIYYTEPKGSVTVSLTSKDNQLEFFVKDTGIGIPKDQQSRIFGKFFRGDNAVRKETEGTGLGLFIAKNIIEAHKGKIWFESVEGKGTTFFFTLPIIG